MLVAFDFSNQGHALVTLYVQFLCSDWSKFDRWVEAENLCSILKLVYFAEADSVLCQLVMFLTVFPLNVQNEIQLLSRVFWYSWLVCLLGFWLRNTSLVKDFGWHRFRFSPCLMRKRVKKSEAILALLDSFSASRMVSLSSYCIWRLFFISNLMKSSVVYARF